MGLGKARLEPRNTMLTNIGSDLSRLVSVETPIWIKICLWILLACIFIASPYWSGLYFYNHMLPASLAITLIAGIVFIWLWTSRTTLSAENVWKTFYPYLGILVAIYTIDAFISPAQSDLAVEGIMRQFGTLGIVIASLILFQSLRARKLFLGVLLITGAWTSLFALAAGYGSINFDGAIMQPGNRLASVFQYANTNASFAAAFVFISFFFPLLIKRNFVKSLISLATYIILLNLTFSYSRGAWITFAILALIMIILLPKVNRIPLLVSNIPALLAFAITLNYQTKAIQSTMASTGWTSLVIGLAISGVLSFVLNKLIDGKTLIIPKWVIWGIGGVLVLIISFVGIKALHHGNSNSTILSRIANINLKDHSVQERFVYYKDGISIFSIHPVLGNGFGTWAAMFQKYASYPYWSKHEHSYWIQLLVETGILGITSFLVALGFYVRSIVKILRQTPSKDNNKESVEQQSGYDVIQSSTKYNISEQQEQKIISWISLFTVASILFHASIDFDMSYGLMNFLLWTMMVIGVQDVKLVQRMSGIRLQSISSLSVSLYSVGTISMFSVVILTVMAYSAANYSQINSNNIVFLNLQNSETAQSLAGYNSQYALTSAKLANSAYMQNNNVNFAKKALQYAKNAVSLAPNDPDTLMTASQISYKYGQFQQALDYAKRAYESGKFGQQYTEQYMVYLAFQAEENLKKNPTVAKQYNENLLSVWKDTQMKVENIQTLPSYLPPEKPFALSDQMKLRAAEAYVMLGQDEEAKPLLDPLIKGSKDPTVAFTAEVVWNVMVGKKMVNEKEFNVGQIITSNQSIAHEFNLLMAK